MIVVTMGHINEFDGSSNRFEIGRREIMVIGIDLDALDADRGVGRDVHAAVERVRH